MGRGVSEEFADAEVAIRKGIGHLLRAGKPSNSYRAGLGQLRLAKLYVRHGELERAALELAGARDVFVQIAEEYPDEPYRNLRLVVLLTMAPLPEYRDPARALQVAMRALNEDSGIHNRYLALAYLRSGAWTEAMES